MLILALQASGYAAFGRGSKGRARAGEPAEGEGEAGTLSPKRAKRGACPLPPGHAGRGRGEHAQLQTRQVESVKARTLCKPADGARLARLA